MRMAGRIQSGIKRLGATSGFVSFSRAVMPKFDPIVRKLTRDRWNVARWVLPTLMLVHTGRKTGQTIHTPLTFVREGNAFGVAATNWARAPHPAWSSNLIANPDVSVVRKGKTIPVRARLLSADEKAQLWTKFVDLWPAYASYAERIPREVRVFLLEPR